MLVVCAAVSAVAWGLAGLTGAIVGVGLVVASFTGSSVVIAWTDAVNPRLLLPVGLLTYVVKFAVIGMFAVTLAGTGWAGLPACALGIAVGTVAWATAQAVWTWRAKIPYVDV